MARESSVVKASRRTLRRRGSLFAVNEAAFVRDHVPSLSVIPAEPVNPPNPKQRYGDKKPNVALVPPVGVIYAALALGDGATKYGPYNWRDKKVEARTYVAAAKRHIDAWFDGEELSEPEIWEDPETGEKVELGEKPHLGHALACLFILADAMEAGMLIDNRPKRGGTGALLKKWTKK